MNAQGQLVTADGYQVIPQTTIPQGATNITISSAGQVQVTVAGATAPQQVGQLQLATFFNNAGLKPQGNNLFTQTDASGAPTIGQRPACKGWAPCCRATPRPPTSIP